MSNEQPTNTAAPNWSEALKKLGPIFTDIGSRIGPTQGIPTNQPVVGQIPQQNAPMPLPMPQTLDPSQIKTDPRAQMSPLPQPIEQPLRQGYQPTASRDLMQMLNPQGAAVSAGIQGVTQFVTNFMQQRDQKQHAEAANAAQALMQAIGSGDYVQAQSIMHDNEKIFNKVYKGWLQRADQQKKEQESKGKQKPPDPDIQGFEAGLQNYFSGKSQQAPQPPRTLQGKSGAQYFLPRATPGQQIAQQQQSSQAQALRQQPSLGVPGGTLTPEEAAKLQGEYTKLQTEYVKQAGEFQKSQAEVQKAQFEMQKSEQEAIAAKARGESITQINRSNLDRANVNLDIQKARLANTQAQLQNIKARGALTQRISLSMRKQFSAIAQAEGILNQLKAQKDQFTPEDIQGLAQQLRSAGASTLASSLTKYLGAGNSITQWWNKPDVESIRKNLATYKQGLIDVAPADIAGTYKEIEEAGDELELDDETLHTGDIITVSPEDMK